MVTRSQCRCMCHTTEGMKHVTACCTPDPEPSMKDQIHFALSILMNAAKNAPYEHEEGNHNCGEWLCVMADMLVKERVGYKSEYFDNRERIIAKCAKELDWDEQRRLIGMLNPEERVIMEKIMGEGWMRLL